MVLLIMSFATKGTVPPEAALALVLGANLGAAINPILEGATGNDPAARRLPLGNLLNRVVGIAAALLALPWITKGVLALEPSGARAVADFHTAFNVALRTSKSPGRPNPESARASPDHPYRQRPTRPTARPKVKGAPHGRRHDAAFRGSRDERLLLRTKKTEGSRLDRVTQKS